MYEKIISIAIGYLFGCFLTAELAARKYAGRPASEVGDTGNPGMANIMAALGFVPGILTLAGDLGKCILAAAVSYGLFRRAGMIVVLYAGLGCTLGHDFPFWRRFRGGKGVATTSIAIVLYAFWAGLTANIAGMLVVFAVKYLCIGGPVIPLVFAGIMAAQGNKEAAVLSGILTVLSIYAHSSSMRGIRTGGTKKIDVLKKLGRKWIVLPTVVIVTLVSVCFTYFSDYYRASAEIRQKLAAQPDVTASLTEEGLFLDGPGEEAALIFYPGAKVEYTAYAPLLQMLAADGIDCFLVKMPLNFALAGKNRAAGIIDRYPYGRWYLGGHSLGGAVASMFAEKNELDGLILLAAYPVGAVDEPVLEIYGDADGVLNMKKRAAGDAFLKAENSRVEVIGGGNHAQFGDYGGQRGDGTASISREEQQKTAVKMIEKWIVNNR